MNERRTWFMIACMAALLLAGCRSAATRVHSLDVTVPAARMTADRSPALRVDSLSVPAGWDRLEILRPSSTGQLEISDFDHWSAPLGQAARQALSADLSQRLPPGSVIFPRLPKPEGALGLNVDILEFSMAGSRASMQVSWVISSAANSPDAKRSEALLLDSLSSTEPAAVVQAWSRLIGQLADHIAADTVSYKNP